jgi:glycosyltransferase involved in cell wall biosynthesis
MVHNNPVRIAHGKLCVDRKFLTGMERFCAAIPTPLASVHPAAAPDFVPMDPVEVPVASLGFRIASVPVGRDGLPLADGRAELRRLVAEASLVYGHGLGAVDLARELGKPYILLLEYDLQTQITVAVSQVRQPWRRMVRTMRNALDYRLRQMPEVRRAHSVHCNGYPIYEAVAPYQSRRLLYLDSRMEAHMVVPAEQLAARLQGLGSRPLRLLYSGRFEPMKGALDAVEVGLACLRRGLDIELDCFGQGSQREAMVQQAARSGGRIRIHDAIPFPELVMVARQSDLFVCCHIQNDPSCTYIESLGAGLPIIGYRNRMWGGMCDQSRAGLYSPLGKPEAAAANIALLQADPARLTAKSLRAREFALQHTFEREFARRTEALCAALAEIQADRVA